MALKGNNLQVRMAIQQGTHQAGARLVATKDKYRGWVQDGLRHGTNLRHGVESLPFWCPAYERTTLSQLLHVVAPLGIEPRSQVPETYILSIVLRGQFVAQK